MGARRCIISFATADKQFRRGLDRLRDSARAHGYDGEIVTWPPATLPEDCPSFSDVPYAFKPFCFQQARDGGMEAVLWLDSSCVVIRPLDEIFAAIEEDGYALFRNGAFRVGAWCGDEALARFDMTRDEAMKLPELVGSAIGLRLDHPTGAAFLERWLAEARDGRSFRGVASLTGGADDFWSVKWNYRGRVSLDARVRGHRFDQSVAGLVAHRLGMRLRESGIEAGSPDARRADPRTAVLIDRAYIRGPGEGTAAGRVRNYLWRRSHLFRRVTVGAMRLLS
jgi:hypothetical protein